MTNIFLRIYTLCVVTFPVIVPLPIANLQRRRVESFDELSQLPASSLAMVAIVTGVGFVVSIGSFVIWYKGFNAVQNALNRIPPEYIKVPREVIWGWWIPGLHVFAAPAMMIITSRAMVNFTRDAGTHRSGDYGFTYAICFAVTYGAASFMNCCGCPSIFAAFGILLLLGGFILHVSSMIIMVVYEQVLEEGVDLTTGSQSGLFGAGGHGGKWQKTSGTNWKDDRNRR